MDKSRHPDKHGQSPFIGNPRRGRLARPHFESQAKERDRLGGERDACTVEPSKDDGNSERLPVILGQIAPYAP